MGTPIAHIGSTSSHGGVVVTGKGNFTVGGIPISTIGDMHVCPIHGHGTTPLVTSSSISSVAGEGMAQVGSITGCGAVVVQADPLFTTD